MALSLVLRKDEEYQDLGEGGQPCPLMDWLRKCYLVGSDSKVHQVIICSLICSTFWQLSRALLLMLAKKHEQRSHYFLGLRSDNSMHGSLSPFPLWS